MWNNNPSISVSPQLVFTFLRHKWKIVVVWVVQVWVPHHTPRTGEKVLSLFLPELCPFFSLIFQLLCPFQQEGHFIFFTSSEKKNNSSYKTQNSGNICHYSWSWGLTFSKLAIYIFEWVCLQCLTTMSTISYQPRLFLFHFPNSSVN